MEALYFESPAEAVSKTAELLSKKDWETLSRYYDLSETEIAESELTSGKFFVTEEEPEIAHPAGFWRYKHPFAPGFKYQMYETLENNEIRVWVFIEIDQGDGMVQEGRQSFIMKKSDEGYQIRPGLVDNNGN